MIPKIKHSVKGTTMKAVKKCDQGFRGKKGGMNMLSTEDYYNSETFYIVF